MIKMDFRELDGLGEPSLEIAGLRLWIHGRASPNSMDYWDGNWLGVTAYYLHPYAAVRAQGVIVHLGEIAQLLKGLERMYETLKGEAKLDCIELNLNVSLVAGFGGSIETKISITPDHMTQSHVYKDGFDQTYLPPIISDCRSILNLFEIREVEKLPKFE
jgi:hypothetical protein